MTVHPAKPLKGLRFKQSLQGGKKVNLCMFFSTLKGLRFKQSLQGRPRKCGYP